MYIVYNGMLCTYGQKFTLDNVEYTSICTYAQCTKMYALYKYYHVHGAVSKLYMV